jgi:hypothetical protein
MHEAVKADQVRRAYDATVRGKKGRSNEVSQAIDVLSSESGPAI